MHIIGKDKKNERGNSKLKKFKEKKQKPQIIIENDWISFMS